MLGNNLRRFTLQCWKSFTNESIRTLTISGPHCGRYGHRLIKIWEQKEYTTDPIRVWRTGGRLPTGPEKHPGRKWTSKLGGGLDRDWYWVQHSRLSKDDVDKEKIFCERVVKIQPDDNRSGYIALVAGPEMRRWVLATTEMKVGDLLKNSAKPETGVFSGKSGDAFPLKLIPQGTRVCSVECLPGNGGRLGRSAGNYCIVLRKAENNIVLQIPSGREVSVHPDCVAVVGQVSNVDHDQEDWGSAQQSMDYGIRPGTGKWHRKDGRHGRKIHPAKPMIVYNEAQLLQEKKPLEE